MSVPKSLHVILPFSRCMTVELIVVVYKETSLDFKIITVVFS